MPFGKTYTVRESAAYLRVSTKTIRRYLKKGLLKYKIIPGKHGNEFQIFKRSLDKIYGHIKSLSKGKQDLVELNRLYYDASPEVKEVVMKILKSTSDSRETKKSNGLIGSIFKRKNGDYQ